MNDHVFRFEKKTTFGSEALTLTTKADYNADGELLTNQEFSLQSEGNHATIHLYSICIKPEELRQLANELDTWLIKAQNEFAKTEEEIGKNE